MRSFRMLCAVGLVCLGVAAVHVSSAAATTLRYTNECAEPVTEVHFSTYGEEAQITRQRVAPGKAGTVDVPKRDVQTVMFVVGGEHYTFPIVSFFQAPDLVTARLGLNPLGVPFLALSENETLSQYVTGNNTAWGDFPQALGAFPFAPGITTREKALAIGAKPGDNTSTILVAPLEWVNFNWRVSLIFEDEKPDSTIASIHMRLTDPVEELDDEDFTSWLEENGYRLYFIAHDDDGVDLTELAAEGKELPDRFLAAAGDWTTERRIFFPGELLDGLTELRKQDDGDPSELLADFVQYPMVAIDRKDDSVVIILAPLPQ